MFYKSVIVFYTVQIIIKVASYRLSLIQYGNNESDLLYDRDSSRAFCFPSEEMMAEMSDENRHHNWGFSSALNYSISLQRVGQVLCRQLGFPIFERIVPKAIEEKREKILWASECLGYEPSITHCLHEEIQDPQYNCTKFVGLKCANCDDKVYTISLNETLNVTSPGYPNLYNDNSLCRWTVRKNVPSPFAVSIKYLSLPSRNLAGFCSKGSLNIMSRKDEFSDKTVHATLCGELEDKLILVNNSILDLKLYSGLFHPRPYGSAGFRLVISIVEDLQAKGIKKVPYSLSGLEIVGITFAALIILAVLSMILRILSRKMQRKQSQRRLARTLHSKPHERNRENPIIANPHVISTINGTPLPALPKNLRRNRLNTSDDQERKLSISSGIYEDILHSRKSVSYLQLEDINNKSEEKKTSFKYDFKIPTIEFTAYSDDANSCPSDIPTCSFTSDLDSVFGSGDMASLPQSIEPRRNSTYTVIKPRRSRESNSSKSSSSINVLAANKNKRFKDLQYSGQRCFSDSDVKTESIPENNSKSLHKTYTQRFSLSK